MILLLDSIFKILFSNSLNNYVNSINFSIFPPRLELVPYGVVMILEYD